MIACDALFINDCARVDRYSYARLMQHFSNNLNTECRVYMLVWEMHHRQFKAICYIVRTFQNENDVFPLWGFPLEKKDVFMVILFSSWESLHVERWYLYWNKPLVTADILPYENIFFSHIVGRRNNKWNSRGSVQEWYSLGPGTGGLSYQYVHR